ncbi:MAG: aminoacyl-tRNA hydrolase, partial [Solirubrobacteraceae bacterium]
LSPEQKRRVIARLGPRVVAIAQDSRSQAQNRELALQRLAQRLAGALTVSRPRTPTRPSKGSVKRRQEAKRHRSQRKRDRRRPGEES